jgi:hypothetical protein
MRAILIVLWGVFTWYNPVDFGGNPYCGGGPYTSIVDVPPWIAVSVDELDSGAIQCGDEMWVYLDESPQRPLRLQAMDAGPFYDYYIRDRGPHVKIRGDIPHIWWPFKLTTQNAKGYMINHSAATKELLRHIEE